MVAEEFRMRRESTGLSQDDAARFLGVSRTTLQNWERGTTGIPGAVEHALKVWERRVRQETARHGPVTLVYSDGPFFRSAYGPQTPGERLFSEQYAFNSQALERVRELARGRNFHNYFIVERGGSTLWDESELAAVIEGTDGDAPTLENLRQKFAESIRALSGNSRENLWAVANHGPRIPQAEEQAEKIRQIEALASELDQLVPHGIAGTATYHDVEQVTAKMRKLGKYPHTHFVSEVARAYIALSTLDPRNDE
jgi:DNA-binding XRE family transcriptional regulator